MMRSSFALGGLGSGVVNALDQLHQMATVALANSPQVRFVLIRGSLDMHAQVILERSFRGWKEIEYEVVRDAFDNTITVCNMENFDPLVGRYCSIYALLII